MATNDSSPSILHHPWFPKTNPPLGGGSRSGDWLIREQSKLGTIAESLVYEVASSRVNSLPSPWSRALQFEQAVINERYPTRDDLLSELFGCLATVALWEMVGLKMDAERVALTDHTGSNDEAVGPFARSLYASRPSGEKTLYNLADGSNPWEVVHVLKVDDLVIGFTSPATLLCPAVHLPQAIPGMKWTAGGHFRTPTEFLSPLQKEALAAWLDHVRQGILNAKDQNSQTMTAQIDEVLKSFSQDLTDKKFVDFKLSSTVITNLPEQPEAIYLLARAASGGENTTSMSTLLLDNRKSWTHPESPVLPVILLDSNMPSRLGLPASEITLYKSATLESVGFDKKRLQDLYKNEIEVLIPDDFFLSELYLLRGEASLPNSWIGRQIAGKPLVNGKSVTPLLPFKERIRDFFSSEELSRQCSLRLVANGGGMSLNVTLSLYLAGHDNPYSITRIFPIQEKNLIDEDLPVIAVWPNIGSSNWKNYIIFSENRQTGLTVDGFSDYEPHFTNNGNTAVKYFSCKSFPDLIKLNERNQYRGLIPVNPPPPVSTVANSWRVGLDFGTSFTNFYIDEGGGPERKPLDTRIIPLTLAEQETKVLFLNTFFIPESVLPKGNNPPTSTAISLIGWKNKNVTPRIFHEARVQWPSSTADGFRGKLIQTGFKWTAHDLQVPFLTELALLISCNAAAAGVTGIDWSVSYPSALSSEEIDSYQGRWEAICRNLRITTGLNHQLIGPDGENGYKTEAVAFARYFGNYRGYDLDRTACLDVGGGTTDISIWQRNELIHQVSVPFAGRDICTKMMLMKPSFISYLFPSSLTGQFTNNSSNLQQDPNSHSWLESCLRLASQQLLDDRIQIERSRQNQQFIEFISLMAISFGGLYHYLGFLLDVLTKEGRFGSESPIPVYMGGNGACFLHWLVPSGKFKSNSDVDRLMIEVQRLSAGFPSGAQVSAETILSDDFKNETAHGIISSGLKLKVNIDSKKDKPISGEGLRINNKIFTSTERINIGLPLETIIETYELTEFSQLQKFVNNYDQALSNLEIKSLMPISSLANVDKLWAEVEKQSSRICGERAGIKIKHLENEPGFIIGLRALSNVLASQWSKRF